MTESPPTITAERGLEVLCQVIQAAERKKPGEGASIQRRIRLHLKALTGQTVLLAGYHNNDSITDDEKIACYKDCVRAITCGNFSVLKGQNESNGRSDPLAHIDVETAVRLTTAEPPLATPGPIRRNTLLPERVEIKQESEPDDELSRLLLKRLAPYLPKSEAMPLDEDRVKEIVKGCLNNGEFPSARIEAIARTVLATAGVTRIEVKAPSGSVIDVGRQHYKFPLLPKVIACRIPFVLTGPAGSFKTTAVEAAFKACELEFEAMSVGPMTSKADLFGFVDAGGTYRITSTVRRAVEGGGMLWDEVDAANAGVLTGGNMLLANGYVATPGGMKDKSKDFCLGATANTFLLGGDRQYIGRNQLDAATVDRFAFIEWDYDEGMEAALIGVRRQSPAFDLNEGGTATPAQWYERVLEVRRACQAQSVRHVVSPRATIHGAKLLSVGVGKKHVEEMVLWKGLERTLRQKVGGA